MVLADVRPDAVDLLLRAGNTVTVTLEWPTGSLAGRSFTSTLDGQALALSVVDDTMTIVADDLLTGALTTPVEWLLLEDIEGTDEPALIGTWTPSNSPRAVDSATVTVTEGAATVTVSPASAQASIVALENRFFTPHVTRTSSFGERWFQAREEASDRQVHVHMWGGSVTDGFPGPTDPLTTSYAGRVETALREKYGDGGSGYLRRVSSQTGTWSDTVGFGSTQSTATAAASRSFTGLSGTEIKIYCRNTNISGTFRYQVDGGGFTNVTPPTGFGQEPGVVTISGLEDVDHTVDIEWVSGTIAIHGVRATYPTGIVTNRCAIGGRAFAQYGRMAARSGQLSIGITNASPTVTAPAPGPFDSSMEGKYLWSTSSGLPFNARIDNVIDAETATLDDDATATATATILALLTTNRPTDVDAPGQTIKTNVFAEGLGQPDLVIVTCGLNDSLYTATTTTSGPGTASGDIFRDGLSNLMRAYTAERGFDYTPDFLVVSEHLGNSADRLGAGAAIAAQAKDLAMGMGGAHVDVWGIGRRSWSYWDGLGFFFDVFHLNDDGAQAMADPVIALLTS